MVVPQKFLKEYLPCRNCFTIVLDLDHVIVFVLVSFVMTGGGKQTHPVQVIRVLCAVGGHESEVNRPVNVGITRGLGEKDVGSGQPRCTLHSDKHQPHSDVGISTISAAGAFARGSMTTDRPSSIGCRSHHVTLSSRSRTNHIPTCHSKPGSSSMTLVLQSGCGRRNVSISQLITHHG